MYGIRTPQWFSFSFFHRKRRPVLLETRSSTWFITATVCTAIFTDVFLYAVIVPVFPFSLRTRIGVPEEEVQHWLSVLLAVYGAALLAGSPISGYLADRVKYRRWPMLVGLIAILGSTLLLCLAKSLALLILGRVLQGLSASVVWVVGLALLADTVGGEGIAMALGYVAIMYSLGTLIAPLLGGIVYHQSGYYAVFAMTFGVIVLDVILRLALIEKKQAEKWLKDDSGRDHELSPHITSQRPDEQVQIKDFEAITSTPVNTTTIDPEKERSKSCEKPKKKRRSPAIFSLLTSPRILSALWATIVMSSIMSGFDTVLTLFVNRTFGWNSLAAGVLFLAPLVPSFFGPLFGKYVDKHGGRWISAFGFLFTVPFLVLMRLVDHNSIKQKVLLVALLVFIGLGIACAMSGVIAEFAKVLDAKEQAQPGIFGEGGAYAQSYGIFNVGWAAGSLVGAFWAGGIYGTAGWDTVTWTWALLCGLTALPVVLFTDGWVRDVEGRWRGTSRRAAGGELSLSPPTAEAAEAAEAAERESG